MEYKKNLISIDHTKREATFQQLDSEDLETETLQVCIKGMDAAYNHATTSLAKALFMKSNLVI